MSTGAQAYRNPSLVFSMHAPSCSVCALIAAIQEDHVHPSFGVRLAQVQSRSAAVGSLLARHGAAGEEEPHEVERMV